MRSSHLILIFLLSLGITGFSQVPEKIKVKKDVNDLYFFQKGNPTDTITDQSGNLFYLSAGKEKACHLKIEIENGQLLKLNDTTFQLKHFVRLNYLHIFDDNLVKGEKKPGDLPKPEKNVVEKCSVYKVMINGFNISVDPNVIVIRFVDTENDKVLLSNKFYYR